MSPFKLIAFVASSVGALYRCSWRRMALNVCGTRCQNVARLNRLLLLLLSMFARSQKTHFFFTEWFSFYFASFIIRLIMLLWHWHSIYKIQRLSRVEPHNFFVSICLTSLVKRIDEWSKWRDHRFYSWRSFVQCSVYWVTAHTTHNMDHINVATNDNEWKMWRVFVSMLILWRDFRRYVNESPTYKLRCTSVVTSPSFRSCASNGHPASCADANHDAVENGSCWRSSNVDVSLERSINKILS